MSQLQSPGAIAQALAAGHVVGFPTDTVPALAAIPSQAPQIYRYKQRSLSKPLILMGASIEDLRPYLRDWQPAWAELAQKAWPGALTMVLPASMSVPSTMQGTDQTIGVRVPAHPEALALLKITGPLATTSLNPSGQPPLVTPGAIAAVFADLPVLAASFPPPAPPSTVIRWQDQGWHILRQGAYHVSSP